jgi:hypothetical protein
MDRIVASPIFDLYWIRRAISLPIVVSLWYLVKLWREAELYGWKEGVFLVWCVGAITIVFTTMNVGLCILGLVAQVTLTCPQNPLRG